VRVVNYFFIFNVLFRNSLNFFSAKFGYKS